MKNNNETQIMQMLWSRNYAENNRNTKAIDSNYESLSAERVGKS